MSAQAEGLRQLSDFFALDEDATSKPAQRGGPREPRSKQNGVKPRVLSHAHAVNMNGLEGGDREFQPF